MGNIAGIDREVVLLPARDEEEVGSFVAETLLVSEHIVDAMTFTCVLTVGATLVESDEDETSADELVVTTYAFVEPFVTPGEVEVEVEEAEVEAV